MQALGEVYANGATVMVRVDECNDHREGADNSKLSDDLRLYIPETVCRFSTDISVRMNKIPCHRGGNARCANVVEECRCAGEDSWARADLLEQGPTICVRFACKDDTKRHTELS